MSSAYKFGCVLLAAGASKRFGENKLLYEWDGQSLIERVLHAIPAFLFDKAVAIVSNPAVAAVAAKSGYICIENPIASDGQGTSAALGAVAMDGMDAALFCVADQPYLTAQSVHRILDAYTPGGIFTLAFEGRRGNPVLFPADLLEELSALSSLETGRKVISRHLERVRLISADFALELFDIDTKWDMESVCKGMLK